MIITCPACASQFRLPDDALGALGRKLRCSSCRHVWFEPAPEPDASTAPAETPAEPTPPEPPEPSSPPGDEAPPEAAPAAPREDRAAPTPPQPDGWAPDQIVPRRPGDVASDSAPSPDPPTAVPAAPTDLPARASRHEARRRRGGAGRLALLLLLVAIVAGGWLGRDQVLRHLPQALPLYKALGLLDAPSSHDVLLEDVAWRVEGDGDAMVLVVSGRAINTGPGFRLLPELVVQLLDEDQAATQTWRIAAPVEGLPPGGAAPFEGRFDDPPRTGGDDWIWVTFADQL